VTEIFVNEEEMTKLCFGESAYHQKLISKGSDPKWLCRVPHGPMKMIDRLWYDFEKGKGKYGKGYLRAEKDISQNDWYFCAHFLGDPVMPGSMGLDGCYQCIGLILLFMGFDGVARALAGTFEYNGQVLTGVKKTIYHVDIKRVLTKPHPLIIADVDYFREGDAVPIYKVRDARLGFFREGALERSSSFRPNWEKVKENCVRWIEEGRQYYLKLFGDEGA